MSRILYVATSDVHLRTFHVPYLEWLTEQGHHVDIAAERRAGISFDCVRQSHWIPFPRKLASIQHLRAYRALRKIIEGGDYDLIHTHTPIPSALTRLAARHWRRRGGRLLYTAHGFHFYRRAPLQRWLVYYAAEWFLSAFTDAILTINHEDFGYVDGKMRHEESFLLPGIGVRDDRFRPLPAQARRELRRALGFDEDAFVLLYTAEFIARKNHRFLVEATSELAKGLPNLVLAFAGKGVLLDRTKEEVSALGLDDHVHFLGFRDDIEKYAAIADVGVSSSRHEGLGLGLLETMLCGVPVIASEDKGHREFVEHDVTGFMYRQGDLSAFIEYVVRVHDDPGLRRTLGEAARERALDFSITRALEAHRAIYAKYLGDRQP